MTHAIYNFGLISSNFLPVALALGLLASGTNSFSAAATLQFSSSTNRVSEASRVAKIPIIRVGPLNESVSVTFTAAGGTATDGSDYVGVTTNFTLAAGKSSGFVTVPLLSDTINEPNETVDLALTGPSVGSRYTAAISIVDNDPVGVISFAQSAFTVRENGTNAMVRIVRTGGTASGIPVILAMTSGTATEFSDYTPLDLLVVFGANETNKVVAVPIANDDLAEGNETFSLLLLTLKIEGGTVLGRQTNATVTIVDDEVAFSFSRAAYGVAEQIGTALVTVLRTGPRNKASSVKVSSTQNGTAIPGVDYRPLTNVIINFPVNVAAKTVALPIRNNSLDDGDKTVELELSAPSAPAQLGTIQKTVVTVIDNDSGGIINFTRPAYVVPETIGRAPITIRRTGGAASGVTVQLRTSDDTAAADADYREVVTNITFRAGELTKTIAIPILNDSLVEDTETLTLTLSDVTGGAILGTNSQAVLRIVSNDLGGVSQSFGAQTTTMVSSGSASAIRSIAKSPKD